MRGSVLRVRLRPSRVRSSKPLSHLVLVSIVGVPLLVFGGVSLARLDEIFALRIRGGRAELVRGRISPALFDELRDVARRFPDARGALRGLDRQPRPELATDGLPEALAQRARNVFALHAATLRGRATIEAPRKTRTGRIVGGLVVGLFVLAALGLEHLSPRGSSRHGSPELSADDADSEEFARIMADEIGNEGMVAGEALARPYVEKLARTVVFDTRLPDSFRLDLVAGPEFAMRSSRRAIVLSASARRVVNEDPTAADLTERFRHLGRPDIVAHCSVTRGCWLTVGSETRPLVSAWEATPGGESNRCTTTRMADRLSSVLHEIAASHEPPYEVLWTSIPPGPSTIPRYDGDFVFVLVTEAERRILDAWFQAHSGERGVRFGLRYPEDVERDAACSGEARGEREEGR